MAVLKCAVLWHICCRWRCHCACATLRCFSCNGHLDDAPETINVSVTHACTCRLHVCWRSWSMSPVPACPGAERAARELQQQPQLLRLPTRPSAKLRCSSSPSQLQVGLAMTYQSWQQEIHRQHRCSHLCELLIHGPLACLTRHCVRHAPANSVSCMPVLCMT